MVKKGDFIEVEYTGKLEDGTVFDTTDEALAKEKGIHNENGQYGSVVICLGQGHLLAGLDDEMEGKEPGKYSFELPAEKAFGKRDGKLIQLIPTSKLTKNNIQPIPGLQLNIDGMIATIKTVSGGRTIVDFNHPLAGKDVSYDIEIKGIVTDAVKKAKALLSLELRIKPEVEEKEGKIVIKDIPEQVQEPLKKRLSEFIDKDIVFLKDKSS